MASAIPDGTSDEEIEKTKTKIESMYCATGFLENCKVSVNESDIEFVASVSAEGLKDETIKGTKKNLRKNLKIRDMLVNN